MRVPCAGSIRGGPIRAGILSSRSVTTRNGMLSYFISARDVREQVNRDYPEGKRPETDVVSAWLQLCDWVIQPENLELGMDAFFFNGF